MADIHDTQHHHNEDDTKSLMDDTLESVAEFFGVEDGQKKLDHREKFKDEDGCARYDDLWGG